MEYGNGFLQMGQLEAGMVLLSHGSAGEKEEIEVRQKVYHYCHLPFTDGTGCRNAD
jgi:hypothetical protein